MSRTTARAWERHTLAQRALRFGGQLALAALTAWMLTRLGIRWDYVADAPTQVGDLRKLG